MTLNDLKRGDVILASSISPLSGLLRMMDGGRHDFAGIYAGGDQHDVICAQPAGISIEPLAKLIEQSETVEAYRFRGDDGRLLDDPALPAKPLFDKIRYFQDKADRFSNEQLVHVALVAATRRTPVQGWLSGLSVVYDQLLDPSVAALDRIVLAGRTPVSYAAFVHRCFSETGLKYRLRLPSSRTLALESPSALARAAYARSVAGAAMGATDADLLRLHARLQALFGRYFAASLTDPTLVTSEAGDFNPPEVVTARDLAECPNLLRVGLLH